MVEVLLSLALLGGAGSEEASEPVDTFRLARQFRIELYDSFRTNREEYDRRLAISNRVLRAATRSKPDTVVHQEVREWFVQAKESTLADQDVPALPSSTVAFLANLESKRKSRFVARKKPVETQEKPSTTGKTRNEGRNQHADGSGSRSVINVQNTSASKQSGVFQSLGRALFGADDESFTEDNDDASEDTNDASDSTSDTAEPTNDGQFGQAPTTDPEVDSGFAQDLYGTQDSNQSDASNDDPLPESEEQEEGADDVTEFQRLRAATQDDAALDAESATAMFDRIVAWSKTDESDLILTRLLLDTLRERISETEFDGTSEQQDELLEKVADQLSK